MKEITLLECMNEVVKGTQGRTPLGNMVLCNDWIDFENCNFTEYIVLDKMKQAAELYAEQFKKEVQELKAENEKYLKFIERVSKVSNDSNLAESAYNIISNL